VPDDVSAEQLASDRARWSFAASAGLLAEFYFCGNGRPRRAQGDVAAYQSVFGLAPAEEIIARWKRDHLARVGTLAACIAKNFDRCLNYCRTERFLLGDHYVIRAACCSRQDGAACVNASTRLSGPTRSRSVAGLWRIFGCERRLPMGLIKGRLSEIRAAGRQKSSFPKFLASCRAMIGRFHNLRRDHSLSKLFTQIPVHHRARAADSAVGA
jgi:hypothetical protein